VAALLNVRLDPEDARRVAALKRAGVKLAPIVRDAIRAEHERRLGGKLAGRKARAIMEAIYAETPDPPGLRQRSYDVRDARSARRAIRRKIRATRA